MIWPLSCRWMSIRFSLTRCWVEVLSHANQTNQYLTSVLVQTNSCVTALASACAMIIIDCCPLLSVTVVYYRLTSITVWYCHPHLASRPFTHAFSTLYAHQTLISHTGALISANALFHSRMKVNNSELLCHELLHNVFYRLFIYSPNKTKVSDIYHSAAIWLCYLVLHDHWYTLSPASRCLLYFGMDAGKHPPDCRTDFDCIWRSTCHNFVKISSYYLYILIRYACHKLTQTSLN